MTIARSEASPSRPAFASPLARPVDLSGAWNATDEELAERLHPRYRQALDRLVDGSVVFRGLPFDLGTRAAGRRWAVLDGDVDVDLRGAGPATRLVVAHFCDSWRNDAGERAPGVPVGWVLPTGEPLARYDITLADGTTVGLDVRRRFEIADGIIGWGYLPFAAIGHRVDATIDWRGPHARLEPGRYAPAGHAGPLTMLAASWGAAQTGVMDFVPTPDDDITYWLPVIPLGGRVEPREVRLRSLGGGRPGSDVVVAAMTLFDGTADPLVVAARRRWLVTGDGGALPVVDLVVAIQSRPLELPPEPDPRSPIGWGRFSPAGRSDEDGPSSSGPDASPRRSIVDLALAPDARVAFGSWTLDAAALEAAAVSPDGTLRIEPLPAANVRLDVRISAGGEPTPSRVRFVAADGRELPPLGHREEVNPGILEDTGAGLILGPETWAYVPGTFQVDVPLGAVTVEVVKGFDHRPVRRELAIDGATTTLDVDLERPIDLRPAGWRASDSHVHFLAPSTALLQAAAEDVTWVHLLATQLGDEHTSIPDLEWGGGRDPSGQHEVIVGTENRHNLLGHLALLGAHRPVLPLSSGGAPEGRIAAPTIELLADWADRCHTEGGLVVGAHFPLPFAEIAADLVAGLIDAVELQVLAPGLDNPSILEWYRFLNVGERVPILGGTDKMSAEVPLGGVRTYAHLDRDGEPTFDAWCAAVRAGRTFVTSGPVIELLVEGHEPGSILSLPSDGGRLSVDVRVRAAQPVIDTVEIVVNGLVVATEAETEPRDNVRLETTIDIESGSWIAARSRSPFEIHSAFNSSMAAHTSPVYVEVEDRPLFVEEDATAILEVIDGTVRWLETMATVTDAASRARLAARVGASATILRDRMRASVRGGSGR